MRSQFILCLLVPLCLSVELSAQDPTSLEWGKPIRYDDFKASPAPRDTAAANISVTILLGYSGKAAESLKFRVVAVMDRSESWMKTEFKRDHILRHEQGHFDIAHIYAKKLEASLEKRNYTASDLQLLNDLYDRFLREMNELQLRYDTETKGGWDDLAQSKWRRFIAMELEKYGT